MLLTGDLSIRMWERNAAGRHAISYIDDDGRYKFCEYSDADLESFDPRLVDVVNAMLRKTKHVDGRAINATINVHWQRSSGIIVIDETDRLFNRFGKRQVLNRWFMHEIRDIREVGAERIELTIGVYVISRTISGIEYVKEARNTALVRPLAWLDPYVGSTKNLLEVLKALETPPEEFATHFQRAYLDRLTAHTQSLALPDNLNFSV